MRNFHFCKNINKYLIGSLAFILIGVVFLCVFGANLDINFTGGYLSSYSYTGEVSLADAESAVKGAVPDYNVTVSTSSDISGTENRLVISIAAKDGITTEQQTALTDALVKAFPDNNINLGEVNNVSAAVGGKFFAKSLFAVGLAAVFVVLYVAIRFRNIGGASAAVTSLVALFHDILVAFFFCVIFRLKIDTNFMAVVLTILGYSLNNTIVIYDRVRENRRKFPNADRGEIVDKSINGTLTRSILTTVTTLLAVVAVAVISEIRGVTSLRSFAIPMAVGLLSGCYSSVCIAGPLWVKWRASLDRRHANKSKKKKKANYAKKKK